MNFDISVLQFQNPLKIKTKLILKTKFFEHNLKHCPIFPKFWKKKKEIRYFRIKISILLYYYFNIHTLTL